MLWNAAAGCAVAQQRLPPPLLPAPAAAAVVPPPAAAALPGSQAAPSNLRTACTQGEQAQPEHELIVSLADFDLSKVGGRQPIAWWCQPARNFIHPPFGSAPLSSHLILPSPSCQAARRQPGASAGIDQGRAGGGQRAAAGGL